MRMVALSAVLVALSGGPGCTRTGPPAPPAEATTSRAERSAAPNPATDLAYVCPMDRDIRSNGPGKCPRCGMELVAGIPDPTAYHMDLTVAPRPAKPREQVRLTFEVFDPWKDRRVERFTLVHEKLFHAFIVSRDLEFFVHDH